MNKKFLAVPVVTVWAALTVAAWFSPAQAVSQAERRSLAKCPAFTAEALISGKFMTDFEAYSLDQFPLRDGFRRLKARFHDSVLGQKDNNGIYLSQGYAAKQEYPLNEQSVDHALKRFQFVYDTYLADSRVFMAVVPDKGYYLAEESGQLAMNYEKLFALVCQEMPWAEHIDLTDALGVEDYYKTDTHWRQEALFPAAEKICQFLNVMAPRPEDYTQTALDRPFYGVYYGQAALPMAAETMYLMESPLLEDCVVYDYETGKTGAVYDQTKLDSMDLYDVYLSGARALLTIENPNAATDRELIIFRDSFGSSMAPLLVSDYAKVTLVDIRYLRPELLDQFLDFHGQDVLFLYSTLVLNSSGAIK